MDEKQEVNKIPSSIITSLLVEHVNLRFVGFTYQNCIKMLRNLCIAEEDSSCGIFSWFRYSLVKYCNDIFYSYFIQIKR